MLLTKTVRHDQREPVPDQLFFGESGYSFHGRIGEQYSTFFVDGNDAVPGGFNDNAVTLLALQERSSARFRSVMSVINA